MPISTNFPACCICNTTEWELVYAGPVRAGSFGQTTTPTEVRCCTGCGVWRLSEDCTFNNDTYASEEYREAMGQGTKVIDFFKAHDEYQRFNIKGIKGLNYRDAVVADVGCGAGSFLDHVSGLAKKIISIEPTPLYHRSLKNRGYRVYPFTSDALKEESSSVDFVTSFQVIEHVSDPVAFLQELSKMLVDDGRIVIATPNRADILLKLIPDEFMPFYFRSAHRWYFDQDSLTSCAEKAGLIVENTQFIHTYDMSNALAWLKDKKPKGNQRLSGILPEMDELWTTFLQTSGQADNIYVTLKKS
jgi:SAM-dependent methyltransferase